MQTKQNLGEGNCMLAITKTEVLDQAHDEIRSLTRD